MHRLFKKLLNAETMLEAVQPLIFVQLFIGFPYYVDQKKNSKKHETRSKTIIIFISIFGYFFFWWNVYQISTTGETTIDLINGSSLFKCGDRFKIYSDFFTMAVIYFNSVWNRDVLSKHLDSLLNIDSTWKVLGLTKDYVKIKRRYITGLALQNAIHVSQMISSTALLYSWTTDQTYSILFVMFVPSYIYTALLTIYLSNLGQARLNFVVINSELELILKHSLLTKTGAENACLKAGETSSRQKRLLRELCSPCRDEIVTQRLSLYWKIYDKVCDNIDYLNGCYFVKIFLILGVSFMSIVINVFVGLNALVWIANNKRDERAFFFVCYSFCQAGVNFFNIFLTIALCRFCQKTVSSMRIIL